MNSCGVELARELWKCILRIKTKNAIGEQYRPYLEEIIRYGYMYEGDYQEYLSDLDYPEIPYDPYDYVPHQSVWKEVESIHRLIIIGCREVVLYSNGNSF